MLDLIKQPQRSYGIGSPRHARSALRYFRGFGERREKVPRTPDGRVTTLASIARAFDPLDRLRILNSRPGLGFVRLQMVGSISLANLQVFHAANALRSAAHAQMHRQDCGALTRRGMACKLKSEPGKARCRLHGGLSTGPKTEEGKARIAEAQRKRWASSRQQLGKPDKT